MKETLLVVAMCFLVLPVLCLEQDTKTEIRAFAEGSMQSMYFIKSNAEEYNASFLFLNDTEFLKYAFLKINCKAIPKFSLKYVIGEGFDVCQLIMDRYPKLGQCLFSVCDENNNVLASVSVSSR